MLPLIGRTYVRFVFGRQWWHVRPFEGDVRTLEHAVIERCLVVKRGGQFCPRPPATVDEPFARVMKEFAKYVTLSSPLTAVEFTSSRPGRKKRLYQRIESDYDNTVYDFHREAKTSAFVKCEKTQQRTPPNGDNPGLNKDPIPRCINTRSAPFHMLYGRYTVPIEKQVYKVWEQVFGYPIITKCMTTSDKASLIVSHWNHVAQFGKPCAVFMDYARMDQHERAPSLTFGHWTTAVFYSEEHQPTLNRVLRRQLKNTATARCKDGYLKADLRDMRMSGDMDTSLGNNSIACGNIYEYLLDIGINMDMVRAIDDGDDAGLFVPEQLLPMLSGISEWYLRRGFSLTLEDPVYELEHIVYCQTRPVNLGHKWMMVRDPEKVINCDLSGYCNLYDIRYCRELFHAIGSGGLALARGVPVLQSFYIMAQRVGLKGRTLSDFDEVSHFGWARLARMEGMHSSPLPITNEARMSFWKAFGITPANQVVIEEDLALVAMSEEMHWGLADDDYTLTQHSLPLDPY